VNKSPEGCEEEGEDVVVVLTAPNVPRVKTWVGGRGAAETDVALGKVAVLAVAVVRVELEYKDRCSGPIVGVVLVVEDDAVVRAEERGGCGRYVVCGCA